MRVVDVDATSEPVSGAKSRSSRTYLLTKKQLGYETFNSSDERNDTQIWAAKLGHSVHSVASVGTEQYISCVAQGRDASERMSTGG